MKKLMYVLAGVILTIGLNSCEKKGGIPSSEMGLGNDPVVKGQEITVITPSTPVVGDVTPYLIPGDNRGGNRTCEDAQAAFDVMAADPLSEFYEMDLGDFSDCGEKVDIEDDWSGPVSGFPYEVWVNEDGTIGFDVGERECLVKIVIVKGSSNANVYYFPGGVTDADGLASPAFDDGRIPWVSNITFCCFCDVPQDEELFYAAKVWYVNGDERWAATDGSIPYFTGSGEWCDYLGFGVYPDDDMNLNDKVIKTSGGVTIDVVGGISVDGSGNVVITLDEGLSLTHAHVYVGDMTDLGPVGTCQNYEASPWVSKYQLSGQTVTFTTTELGLD